MESQILNEIRRTNELLEWAVYLLFAFVAFVIIRAVFLVFHNRKKLKKESLNAVARDLYEQGKYHELIELCSETLNKEGRNSYAIFWKAKSENRIGKTDGLEEAVELLLDMVPSWKEDWMGKYIKTKESQPTASGNAGKPRA